MSGRPRCQAGVDGPGPVLCYYAGDPVRRPECALTAEVLIGRIALCGPCARARSSAGKATVARRLPPGPAVDVLAWVGDADAAVAWAQQQLAAAVSRARGAGYSWAEVAGRLGVSRQAAQQRFGRGPQLKG